MCGQCRANSESVKGLVHFGASLGNISQIGRARSQVGQGWPKVGRHLPMLADIGPKTPEFCPRLVELNQIRQKPDEHWPPSVQVSQVRGNTGRTQTSVWPNSAKVGRIRFKFGQVGPTTNQQAMPSSIRKVHRATWRNFPGLGPADVLKAGGLTLFNADPLSVRKLCRKITFRTHGGGGEQTPDRQISEWGSAAPIIGRELRNCL